MQHILIDDEGGLEPLRAQLDRVERLALDCEAAGFHRYSDRLCLVQVSLAEGADYLLDALAFDLGPFLRGVLEDPEVEVVMHGSDYDLRLLDRDLGIRPRGIFDTQVAAALLGEPGLGLSALLERHVGVRLSKKFQRADWAARPLGDEMLRYAVEDTRHLLRLSDLLWNQLESRNRDHWALEEFELLQDIRYEEPADVDPVARVKGARDLTPRQLERLRVCLVWRDEVAQEMDRAPFRVADDRALSAVAVAAPESAAQLADVRGFSRGLARGPGESLLQRLEAVDRLPESELRGYPPPPRGGVGRPPPEVEERLDRVKAARNRRAVELGLDRGTLLPNAGLLEIAWDPPSALSELDGRGAIKRWQLEAVGDAILSALNGGSGRVTSE